MNDNSKFLAYQGRNSRNIQPLKLRLSFLQEVFKRGILTLGVHNLSFLHTKEGVNKLSNFYQEVFTYDKATY